MPDSRLDLHRIAQAALRLLDQGPERLICTARRDFAEPPAISGWLMPLKTPTRYPRTPDSIEDVAARYYVKAGRTP
jgi:hypothetical protein